MTPKQKMLVANLEALLNALSDYPARGKKHDAKIVHDDLGKEPKLDFEVVILRLISDKKTLSTQPTKMDVLLLSLQQALFDKKITPDAAGLDTFLENINTIVFLEDLEESIKTGSCIKKKFFQPPYDLLKDLESNLQKEKGENINTPQGKK